MRPIHEIHIMATVLALCGCDISPGYFSGEDSGTDTMSDIAADTPADTSTDVPADGDTCGDGVLEEWRGEQCDGGVENSDVTPDACRTDCTLPGCGDSVTDTGEECDDGNGVDNDECSNDCVVVLGDLCRSCESDDECGRDIDLCITLADGDYCAVDCTGEIDCPDGFTCIDITLEDGVAHQCRPVSGVCALCHDPDGDGYGIGTECLGTDCDETDTSIHTGADELCDGVDNNCNGTVDDGDPGGGTTCTTGLSGVCAAGEQHCVDSGLHCEQLHFSSPETCNGLDDNCNGPVDEGDPGGGAVCSTGDLGICAAGVEHCIAGSVVCNGLYSPVPENCSDSLDNDCDGIVNDGCCSHDLCTTGEPLPESCDPCVATICAGDDYCCTGWWDGVCVGAVLSICGLTTCSPDACTNPTNPMPDCGAGHHCVPSPTGVAGCTSPTGTRGQWLNCTDDGDCLPEYRCTDIGTDSDICLQYCNVGLLAACMTVGGTSCTSLSVPAFAGGAEFGVCNVPTGSAPPAWNCEDRFYAADDGCDCGCGVFDPDCASALSSACGFCSLAGSCSASSSGCPGYIHPTENWHCS